METADPRQPPHGVGCPRPTTELDCESARTIIEPYFVAAQESFVAYERRVFGSGAMDSVELFCAPWRQLHEQEGFSHRNFAATTEDGATIVVAPELAELTTDTVAAIMAHEFGHALDYCHPATFVLERGDLSRYSELDPDDPDAARIRLNRMRQWIERDSDRVEQTADAIAEYVLGRQIRYAGPCRLQTFERGTKRPRGLR